MIPIQSRDLMISLLDADRVRGLHGRAVGDLRVDRGAQCPWLASMMRHDRLARAVSIPLLASSMSEPTGAASLVARSSRVKARPTRREGALT
jgi:hypothetical protein